MKHTPWVQRPFAAALAFFCVCMILLAMRPLLAVDETRYLTVAWEMWNGGSKIVPHLNGEVYSHKPPLLFWLINIVWLATGPAEWAARMVAPAAGAVAIVMTGRLSRTLWPDDDARPGRAAWMLATGGVFLSFGSATMFDTLLTVAVLGGMLALWSLAQRLSAKAILTLGAALAFGVLAKGPVVLLHVLPVALALPLWQPAPAGRSVMVRYLGSLGLAVLVALVLVSLWLVPALVFGDAGYRNDILWRQSAGRMVQSFAHDRPMWFFLALLPLYLWPWGWGREILGIWRRPVLPQVRFLLLWAGATTLAFSLISGKQIHYLVPVLPAVALLLSGGAVTTCKSWARFIPLLPAAVCVGLGAAVVFRMIPPQQLDGNSVGATEVALTAGVLAAMSALACQNRSPMVFRALVAPATLLIVQLIAFQSLWQTNNPARLAAVLAAHADAGIATVDTGYAGQFSYSARLAVPVQVLRTNADLVDWINGHPGGLVLSKQAIDMTGLQLLKDEIMHSDRWFAYGVADGS